MTRVLVTGAGGFLGRRVVERLLAPGALGPQAVTRVTLVDLQPPPAPADARVRRVQGGFADPAVLAAATDGGVDLLLHLASVPGGAAEAHPAQGRAVNLDGALALFDAVADAEAPPVVVFTSTIAVHGAGDGGPVGPDTPLRPETSYGAHKLMAEIHLADLVRRGLLDGRSIRPSGIVARPPGGYAGFATAWMSDIFHAVAAGRPFDCPLPAEAAIWLQSVDCAARQVLHAASLGPEGWPAHRALTLPATVAPLGELAAEIARAAGRGPPRVRFAPKGSGLPALDAAPAEALGFRSDGDVAGLVRAVLAAA